MRAHRVKVAQDAHAPAGVAALQVAQHLLNNQLGLTVGVGNGERVVFGQRQALRVAIDRGRRAEHQRFHIAGGHGLLQTQRAHHVVVVIGQWLRYRLTDRLEPGKVNYRRGSALHPRGFFTGDARHPRQRFGLAVAKVVKHRDFMAGVEQLNTGV
jgi:hypothetical protein